MSKQGKMEELSVMKRLQQCKEKKEEKAKERRKEEEEEKVPIENLHQEPLISIWLRYHHVV